MGRLNKNQVIERMQNALKYVYNAYLIATYKWPSLEHLLVRNVPDNLPQCFDFVGWTSEGRGKYDKKSYPYNRQ